MDIKSYVAQQKAIMFDYVSSLDVKPKLVIVQINDDEASNSYIRGKLKDCSEVGIKAELRKFPGDIKEDKLLLEIDILNTDSSVHGIIVQMPLPKQISEEKVKLAVTPEKDVDGFHPLSLVNPCTPQGIINYLQHEKVELRGKNAVVIGRSNIVGKPLARMLTNLDANVTILHSKTSKEDMDYYLYNADIVAIAIGKPGFLTGENLRKDAVVIDVGINRVEGVLVGDAAPNLNVRLQTPVPGGVGLLTRLNLMMNLLEVYKHGV